MFKNAAKLKATTREGTKVTENIEWLLKAKTDRQRNPIEAARVAMEHQRSQIGEDWQHVLEDRDS